jgi:hypothetical protein
MAANPHQLVQCTAAEAEALISAERQDAVRSALAGMKSVQKTGYFSTVRFQAVRSGAGPLFVYTVSGPSIKRVAFGYKTDFALSASGAGYNDLPATVSSSLTETNLSEPGKTRDGETYNIKGIAFHVSSDSDARLTKLVWAKANVVLQMGSNLIFPLGRLDFFPQASGLVGRGDTALFEPPLDASFSTSSAMGNSIEDLDSYFHFPEHSPMIWNPSGDTDSQLSMTFSLPSDITFTALARAAAPGIAPYDPPATSEPFSYVDLTVRLIGESINKISMNQ